jgi:hypothetical protein
MSKRTDDITLGAYDGEEKIRPIPLSAHCTGGRLAERCHMTVVVGAFGTQVEYYIQDGRTDRETYLAWLATIQVQALVDQVELMGEE